MGNSTPRMKTISVGVKGEQQLQQAAEHAQSSMSHSVGHGCAHAERRHVHHDVGELEHHLAQALAKHQHGAAFGLAQHGQRNRKDQAEDHNLQHCAVGDSLGNVLRKDVQDGVFRAELADGAGISRGRRGKLNADAGLAQVDGAEAEEDRDGGDYFEEDDGAEAKPADLPQVGMPGDADHQRSEQQRRDDGLDQPQEDERQDAQVHGDIGEVVPNLRAQQHGDENPCGERAPQASVDDQGCGRNPAKNWK